MGSFDHLPEELPENAAVITCPAGRFAKMDTAGHQMDTYDYFIGKFRQDTEYVYDKTHLPCHFFDTDTKLTYVYEPVKIPANLEERFDSVSYEIVSLPEMKCACKMTPPGAGNSVIYAYFAVQDQVLHLPAASNYQHEYLGFPYRKDNVTYGCFGSRVDSFAGLPECVEKLTVPGGLYVHVKQLEFNGDNPSILYNVCFHHLDELFLKHRPEYRLDKEGFVIARFRFGTSASLFAPLVKV